MVADSLATHDAEQLVDAAESGQVNRLLRELGKADVGAGRKAIRRFVEENPAAGRFLAFLITTNENSSRIAESLGLSRQQGETLAEVAREVAAALDAAGELRTSLQAAANAASGRDVPSDVASEREVASYALIATCAAIRPYLAELAQRALKGGDVSNDLARLRRDGEPFEKIVDALSVPSQNLSTGRPEDPGPTQEAFDALRDLRRDHAALHPAARAARQLEEQRRSLAWDTVESSAEIDLANKRMAVRVTTLSNGRAVLRWAGPVEAFAALAADLSDRVRQTLENAGPPLLRDQKSETTSSTGDALRRTVQLCKQILEGVGLAGGMPRQTGATGEAIASRELFHVERRVLQLDVSVSASDMTEPCSWREDIDDQAKMVSAFARVLQKALTPAAVATLAEQQRRDIATQLSFLEDHATRAASIQDTVAASRARRAGLALEASAVYSKDKQGVIVLLTLKNDTARNDILESAVLEIRDIGALKSARPPKGLVVDTQGGPVEVTQRVRGRKLPAKDSFMIAPWFPASADHVEQIEHALRSKQTLEALLRVVLKNAGERSVPLSLESIGRLRKRLR